MAGFILGFYAMSLFPIWKAVISWCTAENARISGALLVWVGEPCYVFGPSISWGTGAITVLPECCSLEFAAIFCAAVLSCPASLYQKLSGVFFGTGIILSVNLFRIVTLYCIDVHSPALFAIAHEMVWPTVELLLVLVLLISWMQWVLPAKNPA